MTYDQMTPAQKELAIQERYEMLLHRYLDDGLDEEEAARFAADDAPQMAEYDDGEWAIIIDEVTKRVFARKCYSGEEPYVRDTEDLIDW